MWRSPHARNVRNAVLGYNEKVVDQKVGKNIDADVLIADSFGIVCSALWPEYPGWLTIVREKHWHRCFQTFSSENVWGLSILGGLACWLALAQSIIEGGCVWQPCSKWDDSQISGASLFVSDSTELWKASPQQKYTCLLFNVCPSMLRKNYSVDVVDDEMEWV